MNQLIQDMAQQGMSHSLYSTINTTALIISVFFSFWFGKKMGVPLWKMFLLLLVTHLGMGAILGAFWKVLLQMEAANTLGITAVVNSIVRVFVFIPLIVLPVAWILRIKWRHACDAVVMFPLLRSALAQLACIFPGCCRGYEWEWGIYNIKTQTYHFPTQIAETVLTLAVVAYLLHLAKKKDYISDGTLYPMMMILYGMQRFTSEMLRDNEKIFLGCSGVALHAVLLYIVGMIVSLLLEKKRQVAEAQEAEEDPDDDLEDLIPQKG